MDNPFKVTVYNKAFQRVGWVNDFISIKATPRHLAIGSAELVIASNHRQIPNLIANGARLVILYHGEHLMSGYVSPGWEIEGPTISGTATFRIQDDLWLVGRMIGWPVPGAAIDAQGVKEDTRTGPAETVAKGFIAAAVPHMAEASRITVAATHGWGSTVTVASRMAMLDSVLFPALESAGVGLSVKQSGAGLLVDAYVPQVYPRALSEEAGTVISYKASQSTPSATRTIVGGPGEKTSREFRERVSTGRETALGYTISSFTDARSLELGEYSKMDAAGDAFLATAGTKSGYSLTLSETSVFTYGGTSGVHVGDQVTTKIAGQTFTDVLREAELVFPPDDGRTVTPTIGERSDDPNRSLAMRVREAATAIRGLKTR